MYILLILLIYINLHRNYLESIKDPVLYLFLIENIYIDNLSPRWSMVCLIWTSTQSWNQAV